MPLEEALRFLGSSEAARDKEIRDRERARRSLIRRQALSVVLALSLVTLVAVWRAYDAHRNEQQIASALAIAQKATALAESQTAAAQREKRRADKMAQNARTALYEAQREGLKERLEKRVADQTLIVQLLAPNLERRSTSVYPGARYNQARDVGRQANAANLRSAIAWVRRGNGLLYGDRGDVDEAIGAYRKAIAVDRDYEPAYDRLALAYEKGRFGNLCGQR